MKYVIISPLVCEAPKARTEGKIPRGAEVKFIEDGLPAKTKNYFSEYHEPMRSDIHHFLGHEPSESEVTFSEIYRYAKEGYRIRQFLGIPNRYAITPNLKILRKC